MKVKILSSGKIVSGKYLKDMTDDECNASLVNGRSNTRFGEFDVFIKDEMILNAMLYLMPSKYEIIEED